MRIDHVALWVKDLESMRHFYEQYFGATANPPYVNPTKRFRSYFLTFPEGSRLELMHRPDITDEPKRYDHQKTGLVHLAFSVGSRARVDQLTQQLQRDGFEVAGAPRVTGDGYYESVVLDPEGNIVEITA